MIMGAMIYWTEGKKAYRDKRAKSTNRMNYSVRVTNTNPEIIMIFLDFLRRIGVSEKQLRLSLVLHPDLNSEEQQQFWSSRTHIPVEQFHKISFRPLGKKGKISNGICSVICSNKALYLRIQSMIEELKHLR